MGQEQGGAAAGALTGAIRQKLQSPHTAIMQLQRCYALTRARLVLEAAREGEVER